MCASVQAKKMRVHRTVLNPNGYCNADLLQKVWRRAGACACRAERSPGSCRAKPLHGALAANTNSPQHVACTVLHLTLIPVLQGRPSSPPSAAEGLSLWVHSRAHPHPSNGAPVFLCPFCSFPHNLCVLPQPLDHMEGFDFGSEAPPAEGATSVSVLSAPNQWPEGEVGAWGTCLQPGTMR